MGLFEIVITLLLLDVAIYLVNQVIPTPTWMKVIINAILAIGILIWLLEILGFHTGFNIKLM